MENIFFFLFFPQLPASLFGSWINLQKAGKANRKSYVQSVLPTRQIDHTAFFRGSKLPVGHIRGQMSPPASSRQKRHPETCSTLKQEGTTFQASRDLIYYSCSKCFLGLQLSGTKTQVLRVANVIWTSPITNTRRIVSVSTMAGSSSGQRTRRGRALHHQMFSHLTRRAGTRSNEFHLLMDTRTFLPTPSQWTWHFPPWDHRSRTPESLQLGCRGGHSGRQQMIRRPHRQMKQHKVDCKRWYAAGQKPLQYQSLTTRELIKTVPF